MKITATADLTIPEILRAIAAQIDGTSAPEVRRTSDLEWSPTICDGKCVDYAAAEKAAAALGEGWRLPTRWELESILDLTRHDTAVDTTRFPDTKSAYYWTSTPCAWNTSDVWVVGFGNGYVYGYHRSGGACVRAVRSSPAGQ